MKQKNLDLITQTSQTTSKTKTKLDLYPAQKESHDILAKAIQTKGAALDASETGTGKTLKAVELSKTLGKTPLVVCPKTVVGAWEKCLKDQEWGGHVIGWEKLRAGNTCFLDRRGKFKMVWKAPKDYLIIFDECHKGKGIKTLNSRMMVSAKEQGYKILCLSATAAEDPREMKALGFVLGLHNNRNFWDWGKTWGCVFDSFGAFQFPQSSQHKLVELNKLMYPELGHKLTRADLGNHFKECRVITDPITFGKGKQLKKLANELHDELVVLDKRIELDGEDAIALTKILRLRQEIELLKVVEIASLIEDGVANKQSVAVFLNFTETIKAVSSRLKVNHVFLQGGQSKKERDNAVEAFQSNTVKVILCNSAAGGVGVSLHDTVGGHPRLALISPTYNAKDFKQILGRVDRLGGQTDSIQKILVADKTLETSIVQKMMLKIENMDLLHKQTSVLSTTNMSNDKQEQEGGVLDHAEFSPSSLKLVKACAGFLPTTGTNPAAEMGTRVHLALEVNDWSKLNDYEQSLAQYCSNAEKMIIEQHGFQNFEDHKEIRVHVDLIGTKTFGTCDRFCLNKDKPNEALMIDYKTGKHAVEEPATNMQSKCYALGAFQMFPQIDTISFYFICCQRDEILFDVFHRAQVADLVEEISAVITKATKFRSCFESLTIEDLNPASRVCDYCARAGECPAIAAKLMKVAENYGVPDELEIPEVVHGSEIGDPETLSKLLTLAPILEKAISGWKMAARVAAFEHGMDIPDYEVKTRSGRRSITSALAAYGVIKDEVEVEDFLEGIDSFPVTKFEKLVAETAERGKKKGKVADVMSQLEDIGVIKHAEEVQYLSKIK